MYRLFKDVPVRRAQCTWITDKTRFPMKIYKITWTQNVAVGKRALEVFDDVCKFSENVKVSSDYKCGQYQRSQFRSSCQGQNRLFYFYCTVTGRLHNYIPQSSSFATFPVWWPELVKGLMLRCIKTEVIERLNTASELMKVDFDATLVPVKKVVAGVSPQSLLWKSKASDLQMSFRTSCRRFLVAAIEKVLEGCPLKYKSTKAISCLNPSTILYLIQPVNYVWVICSCIYTKWIKLPLILQTVPKTKFQA